MTTRKEFFTRLALFGLLLTAPSPLLFGSGFFESGFSMMGQSDSFRDATETRVFTHKISDQRKGTRLKAKLALKKGEATVRLLDASGTVRWEKTFGQGETSVEQSFNGGPGVWRVELQLKDTSGRYNIRLVDF